MNTGTILRPCSFNMLEFYLLKVSALDVAKQTSYTFPRNGFGWHCNFENYIFVRTNWRWCMVRGFGSMKFVAGVISMPCGAPANISKWFVQWLHRRVIASADAIARRMTAVWCMDVRSLGPMFFVENNENRKSVEIMQLQYVCILSLEIISTGRCETKQLYVPTQQFWMTLQFRKLDFFYNIDAGALFGALSLWNSLAGAISMPCGAPTRGRSRVMSLP